MARVEEVCAIVLETEPTPDVILLQVRAHGVLESLSSERTRVVEGVAISSRGHSSVNQSGPRFSLLPFSKQQYRKKRVAQGLSRHKIGWCVFRGEVLRWGPIFLHVKGTTDRF